MVDRADVASSPCLRSGNQVRSWLENYHSKEVIISNPPLWQWWIIRPAMLPERERFGSFLHPRFCFCCITHFFRTNGFVFHKWLGPLQAHAEPIGPGEPLPSSFNYRQANELGGGGKAHCKQSFICEIQSTSHWVKPSERSSCRIGIDLRSISKCAVLTGSKLVEPRKRSKQGPHTVTSTLFNPLV